MIKILHKYITKELLRVFILTTVALTVILSLGSVLQPMQDYGVSPAQALLLIAYFVPVILTFVMPIAALFAAAITYGRFASDNEFDASRASGVSAINLMTPALVLALLVSAANLLLNFYVVPVFIGKTETNIKANVRNIVFRSIEKQGYYRFRDGARGSSSYILADNADIKNNLLLGVNILQTGSGGSKSLVSVAQANIDFESTDDHNYIAAIAREVYQADSSGVVYSQKLPIKGKFDPLVLDNIKFKKLSELNAISENMLLFKPVKNYAERLLVRVRSELLAEAISDKSQDPSNGFYQLNSNEKIILLSAEAASVGSNDNIVSLSQVVAYEYNMDAPNVLINKWTATSASLDTDEQWGSGGWTLVLNNAVWTDRSGTTGLPITHSIRRIHTPKKITELLAGEQIETIRQATINNQTDRLEAMKTRFDRILADTSATLAIELNTRLVFGIGCTLLVLCGAALGVIFKGGHVLTSFGISVVPAAILIVFIVSGRNLTKNIVRNQGGTGEPGILLIWAGLIVLLILLIAVYKKLLRT